MESMFIHHGTPLQSFDVVDEHKRVVPPLQIYQTAVTSNLKRQIV